MSRLTTVDPDSADPQARALLGKVQKSLGVTPNMTKAMAASPAVLDGYLSLSGALGRGRLPAGLQEQIALACAAENACDYCYSAHHVLGARAGVDDADLASAGRGAASDPRAAAALQFAQTVVRERGHVSDADLAEVRAAGYDDGEIGEIVAAVALNVFTNYFNSVARPEIDFPVVPLLTAR